MCARITHGPHGNWMYTGYFDKCTKYKELGLVPVSIAIRTPPYILDLRYPKLAPTPELFFEWKYGNHRGDNAYYTKRFVEEVLGKFKDPAEALNELCQMAGTSHDRIILLCYEKPGQFCHRHLVANWIGKTFCEEINMEKYNGRTSKAPLARLCK